MITAIDTNVLLDLLIPDAPFGEVSQRAIESGLQAGRLVISDMVYAELAGQTWARYRRQRDDTLRCP